MKPDLYWIPGPWRGRMAIVARPRGRDWLQDEANDWRRDCVDVVVSLLEVDEAAHLGLEDESEAAAASGVRFLSFPIPDRGVPASASAAASLITAVSEALERGENVAVHCRQGLGRSGLIAAGVLVYAGADAQAAIETVSPARGEPVPETPEQRAWVQRLASRFAAVSPTV